jgi:Uma2 family endonuclease
VSTARLLHYTIDEYLRIEGSSDIRHEYLGGDIFAMAGGSPEHAFLSQRVASLLDRQVPADCRVGSSDLRLFVASNGLFTYPDAAVICGPIITAPRDAHAVTNPSVLVEVTSPSTEDYDRGTKLSHYQTLESLRAVVFVSHASRRVTVIERDNERWLTADYEGNDVALVKAPALRLGLAELYSVTAIR